MTAEKILSELKRLQFEIDDCDKFRTDTIHKYFGKTIPDDVCDLVEEAYDKTEAIRQEIAKILRAI